MAKKSSRSSPRPSHPNPERVQERHRALLRQIGEIGLVLRGTIGSYRTKCGNPRCRCHADPAARHGPYPIWTRKLSGKTVTRMLSNDQAKLLRPWIRNMRRLDRLLKKAQKLGLEAAQALLRG